MVTPHAGTKRVLHRGGLAGGCALWPRQNYNSRNARPCYEGGHRGFWDSQSQHLWMAPCIERREERPLEPAPRGPKNPVPNEPANLQIHVPQQGLHPQDTADAGAEGGSQLTRRCLGLMLFRGHSQDVDSATTLSKFTEAPVTWVRLDVNCSAA